MAARGLRPLSSAYSAVRMLQPAGAHLFLAFSQIIELRRECAPPVSAQTAVVRQLKTGGWVGASGDDPDLRRIKLPGASPETLPPGTQREHALQAGFRRKGQSLWRLTAARNRAAHPDLPSPWPRACSARESCTPAAARFWAAAGRRLPDTPAAVPCSR